MSVSWSGGLVLSYAVGSYLDWSRLALFSSSIPIIQVLLLHFCYPSPRWLLTKDRYNEAKETLVYLRAGCTSQVEKEIQDCDVNSNNNDNKPKNLSMLKTLKSMLTSPKIRKSVIICMCLYFFTVFTGYSVITYHAKAILLKNESSSTIDPNVGIVMIGLCKVLGNLFSASIIERVGRKKLLYASSVLIFTAHALLGTFFYLKRHGQHADLLAKFHFVPLALLIVFMLSFPIGWGSVTYILASELVPTSVRPETAVLCSSWEQLTMFVTLQLKDFVKDGPGLPYLYWGFSFCSGFGAIFVKNFLVETSGKSLEEINSEKIPLMEIGDESLP